MPRRIRRYRRRPRRRNNLASRVKKLEKTTKPETKWQEPLDITGTSTFCAYNSGALDQSILDLAQGTTQHSRVGNQVKLKSFYSRMLLNAPASAEARLFRFILYVPRNTTDYLSSGGPSGGAITVLDQIDQDRFTVLFDKTHKIAPTASGTQNIKQIVMGRRFKKMITQVYDSALSGSHTKGDVRLYVVSTQATTSSNKAYLQGYFKTFFIDP